MSRPKAPTSLSDEAKKHWRKVVGYLEDAGVLTAMDLDALTMYCELYSQWVEANDMIRKKGMVIADPRHKDRVVPMTNPYFRNALKLSEQMKAFLTEFGMTPSSRTRVAAANPKPNDEFEDWMKRRRMAKEGV